MIECLLASQRLPEARAEFKTLLDHDRPGREASVLVRANPVKEARPVKLICSRQRIRADAG